jgi:dephospho-CoA kinase
MESGLASRCDSIWVATAPLELQVQRLVQKRGMNEAAALQRINAQPPQQQKIEAASVVIRNDGTFEDAWGQVYDAWNVLFPSAEAEQAAEEAAREGVAGVVMVHRARPRDAAEVAAVFTRFSGGKRKVGRGEVMAAFGEKAFLLLRVENQPLGVVGWKVENLVAQTDDVYIDSSLPVADALAALMSEVERVSKELQCEISLLFLPPGSTGYETALQTLGYQRRTLGNLGVRAWEEAAHESMPAGSIMLFKQLRQDRVLKPV